MAPENMAYRKEDFASGLDVRWCPGCGDFGILAAVQKALAESCNELNIRRENIVFVSGIGCSSRFPYYINCYGFHTIHGRAPAVAIGVAAANPELSVWVASGDGDCLSIGGNHTMHALRRNNNIKVLMFNNRIYGMTKGQYSPTSPRGLKTKSSPQGNIDQPINPMEFALGCNGTLVIRSIDRDAPHLTEMIKTAARHRGTAFVEVLQNCLVYNDGSFGFIMDREQKAQYALVLKTGEPMVFGPEGKYAIVWKGGRLAKVEKASVAEADIVRHDPSNKTLAFALSQLWHPEAVPLGVLYQDKRPVYEEEMLRLENEAKQKEKTDLVKVFSSGISWEVKKP